MVADTIDLGIVIISLIITVALPFLPAAFFLFRKDQWPKILSSAIILGCGIQATLGLLWTHLVGKWPLMEVSVYVALCLLLTGWSFRRRRPFSEIDYYPDDNSYHLALILILGIAFTLRAIHPLQVAYLGQSDAYTHLNYIHNIVDRAFLLNPSYPPGYHWIVALPSLLFSIDPYLITRFGGAFFGTTMVMSVYVLLDQFVNRRAAIFGSFCAAGFPAMVLLMKTGVGVFANQLGLLMLPSILLFYLSIINSAKIRDCDVLLLLTGLCGMAAAVPMMLFHVLLIFVFERLSMVFRKWQNWFRTTVCVGFVVLPALFLIMFHFFNLGPYQRVETANMMTHIETSKRAAATDLIEKVGSKLTISSTSAENKLRFITNSPYFQLLNDYTSIKRLGFGSTKLNMLSMLLSVLFFCCFCFGFYRKKSVYSVIGIWGMLTSVQAGTGFLQFSSYQREGWSLLIATCCLCGIIAAQIYRVGSEYRVFRLGVYTAMIASVVWSVLHPPGHPQIHSSAEDELIRITRFFGQGLTESAQECENEVNKYCNVRGLVSGDRPLTLMARLMVGWGNQGEILPNVIQPESAVHTHLIGHRTEAFNLQQGQQYVILIDKKNELSNWQLLSVFAMVSPVVIQETLRSHRSLFNLNEKILKWLAALPENQWIAEEKSISDNLNAYVITQLGAP